MKIVLIGRGRMGQMIQSTAEAAGDVIAASFDEFDIQGLAKIGKVGDVVMDFSRPSAMPHLREYVIRTGTPLLSGTTGLGLNERKMLEEMSFFAPVLWVLLESLFMERIFPKYLTESEETAVYFRPAAREELERYVRTGEPMDKAGAYGVQGRGALLVERIDGDYFNVVGLPLLRLSRMLSRFGVVLL